MPVLGAAFGGMPLGVEPFVLDFLDYHWDHAELLKKSQGVPIHPGLDNLFSGEPGESHARDCNFLARGSNDAERP